MNSSLRDKVSDAFFWIIVAIEAEITKMQLFDAVGNEMYLKNKDSATLEISK